MKGPQTKLGKANVSKSQVGMLDKAKVTEGTKGKKKGQWPGRGKGRIKMK
mgnify:FL=1